MPAKKEYFEKIGTKTNNSRSHGASNSSNHYASSKVTQPLFDNYVFCWKRRVKIKVGHIISETVNSIKGIDLQMLFEE